jgi:predicted transcriptional regulator
MTMKQKIQAVIDNLPENASIEKAIEELCLLAAVEEGLEQLDRGEGIPDEEIDWEALHAGKS